ncbi:MAG: hypothetical protein ACKOE2_12405 [Actinomycetales bacterium]
MSTPVGYPVPQNSSNAIAALIMAVLGWVAVPVALPIVALVLAQRAEQEIRAAQGWLTGLSLVTAARWVAWVNIALYGFILVATMVSFVVFALVVALSVAFGTTSPN